MAKFDHEAATREHYLRWLAGRRGIEIPHNARFEPAGIKAGNSMLLPMPGYGQPQTVIIETFDENGDVIRSSVIGLDKGKLGINASAVRSLVGKVEKPKAMRAAKAPANLSPCERVEGETAPECQSKAAPISAEAGARPVEEISTVTAFPVRADADARLIAALRAEAEELRAALREGLDRFSTMASRADRLARAARSMRRRAVTAESKLAMVHGVIAASFEASALFVQPMEMAA
jgi:hypothetical protein